MLVVSSNLLPDAEDILANPYAATAAQSYIEGQPYAATIATLTYQSDLQVTISNPTLGGSISLPGGVDSVFTIIANGEALQPAVDPANPQLGEYIHNPYTNTVQIYSTAASAIAYVGLAGIPYAPSYVSGLPAVFYRLPIKGTIQITRQLEQHPSAQFAFDTNFHKSYIESIFAPGRELEIFGIPLRISGLNCEEQPRSLFPDGQVTASVSFSGKWENYLSQPCFLRRDGSNVLASTLPFQDPECTDPEAYAKDPNSSVDISTLLAKIGIPYRGSKLKRVPIPANTPRDAIVSPVQLLDDRLKIANSFVRWSRSHGLETVRINALTAHTIQERDILGEISTGYSGISKPSKQQASIPNLLPLDFDLENFPSAIASPSPQLVAETDINLAFEYANVELQGDFEDTETEKDEFTQAQTPRYVRKESKRTTRIEGDANAHIPLDGVTRLKTMSLCFDLGGQTKTRTYITEEDGAIVQTVQEIWGFAYTSEDIWNPLALPPRLDAPAAGYWQLLRQVTTDYIYDENTGYLLRKEGRGFNTVRYLQETPTKPETQGYFGVTNPVISELRSLYQFFRIPVIERHSRTLRLMPDYSTQGLFEIVKVCNRDGTSSYVPLLNPDYAPPYYIEKEVTETVGFSRRPNPKNIGRPIAANVQFEPDMFAGEESYYSAEITEIIPAVYEEKIVGTSDDGKYPIVERGELITPQKWYRTIIKFRAEGEAIASAREEVSVEEGTGNPPEAERRPPRYTLEKQQPREERTETKQQYKYLLCTEGYSFEDPITGSENFALAETLNEAITAAKCKLALENWRNGYSESFDTIFRPEIKEGDRVVYFCNGQLRDRVVLSVQHILNILGSVNGSPKVTGTTKLTLGKYRLPTLDYRKLAVPVTSDGKSFNIGVLNVINETLDGGITWQSVTSRRNF